MSDQTTATDQTAVTTPNTEAGQTVAQPNAGTEAAAEQPFRSFKSQAELDTFMAKSKSQAGRKALNDQAKALGYEDWEEMKDALQPLRRTTTPENPQESPGTTPAPTQVQSDQGEAKRLKLALSVASDLGLPTALVSRLQGDTTEEMTADANRLLALFQQPVRGPGIPPAPTQNRPVTFTRVQLQDAAFVREHVKEIMQASAEGRIVDS
jgi:hypothetical protein